MYFKTLNTLVFTLLLLQSCEEVFACGSGVIQAPCDKALPSTMTHASQTQVVAALQQQALKSTTIFTPSNKNEAFKNERFTANSLSPTQQNEGSVVASINNQANINRVTFRFRGEQLGYQIDSKIYESLVQSKKIIPIGTQFAVVPISQVNTIKGLVIGGTRAQRNLLPKVNGDEIELVAID